MSDSPTGLDKQALYGDYRDSCKRKEKLYMQAAHKALDIPDDDVNINAPKTTINKGLGTLGTVAVALAGGLPAVALAAWMLFKPADKPSVPVGPVDSEYEVLFWDSDGNPIKVPHVSVKNGKLVPWK